MGEKVLKKCNVCNSSEFRAMPGYEDAHLQQCSNCSFVFSSVIPSGQTLDRIYEDEFNRTTYLSPITIIRYKEILRELKPYRKTNRILDIGAGCGFFLEIAKQEGWEVVGTEISKHCVELCEEKGIEMHLGELASIPLDENSLDAVVSLEVIEHLSDPSHFVSEIHRILRPGGITYISTPNFNAILRYRLKAVYDVISYPIHLCYFTKKTIRKIFSSNGFKVKKVKTTGYSITRKKTSKGISNQDFVSETSDDEMLRYRIEYNGFLRFSKDFINFWLNLIGVGDSLKGYFIKQ